MGRVAVLKIGKGDFDQGFDVSLQVCRDNALPSPEIPGRLPANTEFEDLYTVWQSTFVRLRTQRGTDDDWQIETRPTHYSTSEVDACRYFVRNLETSTRNWLQHSQDVGWQKIRERLLKELANNSDEFRVIITAINSELCKLPWHVWDLMESNPDVEIAFSYPNDRETEPTETNYNNQVRILAVLGDSSGIDTGPDRDAIRQLNDAKPVFLPQPTSRNLIRELRRPEGWDIFFFAGHSETNGKIGRIYINESESLEISDFKNALKEAVRYGLKLAIFNSCDGLGLAQQLTDLHIPVIIVMREPVPDEVAQSFLREFLTEYAHGQPLYSSVRRSRERLEEFQDLPGATWLPVICQNPVLVPPTWQGLRRTPRRQHWLPALKKALVLGLLLVPIFRLFSDDRNRYQLHNDGSIWHGSVRLDNNPKTIAIDADGNQLYQLHNDGLIWRYTGTPCNNNLCPGWEILDTNPKTIAIDADGNRLYQLHDDGSIWQYTGTPCNNNGCRGWVILGNEELIGKTDFRWELAKRKTMTQFNFETPKEGWWFTGGAGLDGCLAKTG